MGIEWILKNGMDPERRLRDVLDSVKCIINWKLNELAR